MIKFILIPFICGNINLTLPHFAWHDNEDCINNIVNQMLWLNDANPIFDAAMAIETGNYKYMAVTGYFTIIPGVNNLDKGVILSASDYDYILIEGTSDALACPSHGKYNSMAYKYAEKYNTYLIEHSLK